MKPKKKKLLVGDFETTVYPGQKDTYVWASAIVEFGNEDVHILHSLDETFDYLQSLKSNIIIYYHNLKFDGSFWLDYLLRKQGFQQAVEKTGENEYDIKFMIDDDMPDYSFKYTISDRGQWYGITIKLKKYLIEIRDSLKLLPFSVKRIGESFGTKHKKLDMEYTGFRYPGCEITEEEQHYIANDVLVVKEALEIMFEEGHTKLTIGSCCLSEFKVLYGAGSKNDEYDIFFPNLYEYKIDETIYGAKNAGDYLRRGYKGGWCYVVKGKEKKIYHHGTTCDVNSLYPSMMSSESGNYYPVGLPKFWHGDYIPQEAQSKYYFITIRTKFYIKTNRLPCIQLKGTFIYPPTEWLETSDICDKDGNYHSTYIGFDKQVHQAEVTMTMTCTDFKLIQEQYNLVDTVILHGCYFEQQIGLFDTYIQKYKKIKMENKGAKRELAKLYLNNLYGKFASSPNSSFKYAFLQDDEVKFVDIVAFDKIPGYIAIGAAITAYARNFTIRAAQQNYYGKDKPGFIYADTDSIHCDLSADEIKGAPRDDVDFCHWKYESTWDIGYFVRQKTYIEHIIADNLKPCEPYYNIKCAGMPEECKQLFLISLGEVEPNADEEYTQEVLDFIKTSRTIEDFGIGLKVPGKLMPKRIHGGILLVDTTYEMR